MTRRGAFIVVEGLDGSGKTSNIRNLGNFMSHGENKHFIASEYDDCTFTNTLRTGLNHAKPKLDPLAETFGFFTSRIEHTQKIIKPYLDDGYDVITDRYYHTTLAYQGIRLPMDNVRQVLDLARPGLVEPDLVLFYDIPVETYKSRVLARKQGMDEIESRGIEYFTNVRANFLQMAKDDPRFVLIDASQPLETVFTETLNRVSEFLRTFDENQI